ncbi:MAG: hypothetical protein COV50_01510, partial [Flavobacteriales bacterium CG11_big_fil_rev_8_21_14_0_20_35_7]
TIQILTIEIPIITIIITIGITQIKTHPFIKITQIITIRVIIEIIIQAILIINVMATILVIAPIKEMAIKAITTPMMILINL